MLTFSVTNPGSVGQRQSIGKVFKSKKPLKKFPQSFKGELLSVIENVKVEEKTNKPKSPKPKS